ncbi:MAG: YjiH family protein [Lawsonibacter sp.]|nr:YjiH family protein [Lawsonibacter sp.]
MSEKAKSGSNIAKFIVLNAIGIFMFFITVPFNGSNSIPVDHIVTTIRSIPFFDVVYGAVIVTVGAVLPFLRKTWNKDKVTTVFSILKLLAIPFLIIWLTKAGPARWYDTNMLPFIYGKVVVPVTSLVPVGAVFLSFLINYGLMEFIGVFMRPVMRPVWKTPGRSAVDAVASFVGSYSVGLLITNRVYKEGFYSTKEASIIATGFSTVSATFMIIVARSAGLLENHWNLYFWSTLIITFIVTAITTRIYPLSRKPDTGYNGMNTIPEPVPERGKLVSTAVSEGLEACSNAPGIVEGLTENFIDGLNMALGIGPSLMSIGFLGLLLAEYTPLFTIIGYIFVPFALLLGFGSEAVMMGKACAISLAEMFLPVGIVGEGSPMSQYVIAILCVSEVLFFSASIPCVLGTDIDISLKDIVIIWVERVILSLLIAGVVVRFLFPVLGVPL